MFGGLEKQPTIIQAEARIENQVIAQWAFVLHWFWNAKAMKFVILLWDPEFNKYCLGKIVIKA